MSVVIEGRHGYGPASQGKCKCDVCREAMKLYRRGQRARRLASGLIRHGVRASYDCGCRCLECTAAHQRAYADYCARKKARS